MVGIPRRIRHCLFFALRRDDSEGRAQQKIVAPPSKLCGRGNVDLSRLYFETPEEITVKSGTGVMPADTSAQVVGHSAIANIVSAGRSACRS